MKPMRYKLFGKTGLRVSELCLGTMTFGEDWGNGADKEVSRVIFDKFVERGGNFLDTANRYTEGTSERFLGEFIKSSRDHFVVASKYSLFERRDNVNASGNHKKNMRFTIENSLKRLGTDYLDILWLHAWDFTTAVDEVMRALDDLVRQGKVLHIGVSDTPAWIVAKSNTMAELKGWTSFAGLQIEYSLIQRSAERDLLPMALDAQMMVTPWSPLGAGMLTGKYNTKIDEEGRLSEKSVKINDRNREIAIAVSEVAESIGASPAQVALKWLKTRGEHIVPIIGARKVEQITDSLGCLDIELPDDALTKLNDVSQIELGFPHDFLNLPAVQDVSFGGNRDMIDF